MRAYRFLLVLMVVLFLLLLVSLWANQYIYSLDRVVVLDAYALLVGDDGLTRPEYAADTLHVNASGYAVLNEALNATLGGM
jgi:lysophospholipase L1-like esterase